MRQGLTHWRAWCHEAILIIRTAWCHPAGPGVTRDWQLIMFRLIPLLSVLCLFTLDHHAVGVDIPPEWVHVLKLICDAVESNAQDVLGYPLVREVSTFSTIFNHFNLLHCQVGSIINLLVSPIKTNNLFSPPLCQMWFFGPHVNSFHDFPFRVQSVLK